MSKLFKFEMGSHFESLDLTFAFAVEKALAKGQVAAHELKHGEKYPLNKRSCVQARVEAWQGSWIDVVLALSQGDIHVSSGL